MNLRRKKIESKGIVIKKKGKDKRKIKIKWRWKK
jgi:hypothetical protein